ncbi:probable RNA methyltransferase CG11342 [Venturia canescens]|uniref:probable RNA methyltransferase CG11342 n=1 Tax=Venturia canescens TaxID=32260 RepID=UPI001C9CEFA0|nr:probable RNA methyltransferase CG11342 [Venturia canescens]
MEQHGGTTKNCKITASNDPGASRYGNFINYYTFRSADERAQQLPRGIWRNKTPEAVASSPPQRNRYIALDVGCNAGDLTMLLLEFLREATSENEAEKSEVHLLGIDIDSTLITRAQEQNTLPEFVSFECLDFMDSKDREKLMKRFLSNFSRDRFDVVFCFSVTMWIHVNHGDEGLVNFLEAVCSLAEMVVVEPQPGKCYRNASRRLRRAGHEDFPFISSMKLNNDVDHHIDRIILDRCSFERVSVTNPNEWGRKLLIYRRVR